MKKLGFIGSVVFLSAVLFMAGCGDNINYRYEVPLEVDFIVPQDRIQQFLELTITVNNVSTLYDEYLSTNGMSDANVTTVSAGRAILRSKFGNVDVGFIDDISVRAVKVNDPDYTKELFYFTDFRFNEGTDIELFGTLIDAKEILSDPTINLDIVMTFQGIPGIGDVPFELDLSYLVFDE